MDQDILYHLALGSESHDLQEMFGDVKVSPIMFESSNYKERKPTWIDLYDRI